jgi:hypothetical protein
VNCRIGQKRIIGSPVEKVRLLDQLPVDEDDPIAAHQPGPCRRTALEHVVRVELSVVVDQLESIGGELAVHQLTHEPGVRFLRNQGEV